MITNSLSKIYSENKKDFNLIFFLGIIVGILDIINISLLIPFITKFFYQATDNYLIVFFEKIFNLIGLNLNTQNIAIIIIIIFLIRTLIIYLNIFVQIKLGVNFRRNYLYQIYSNFIKREWSFINSKKLEEIQLLTTMNINRSSELIDVASSTGFILSGFFIYIISAFFVSYKISLIILFLGIIILFFYRPINKKVFGLSGEIIVNNKSILNFINQSILGLKEIKIYNAESSISNRIQNELDKIKKLEIRNNFISRGINELTQPIALLTLGIVFIVTSLTDNKIDVAIISIMIILGFKIINYVQNIQRNIIKISDLLPHLDRIIYFKSETKEVQKNKKNKKYSFKNKLIFKGIIYQTLDGNYIKKYPDFEIEKNKITTFIGQSGSGKTTILDLIAQLIYPIKGEILIDSINLKNIKKEKWLEKIAYISQEPFILDDTIENNIKFFDQNISTNEIQKAIKESGLEKIVARLPDGLETKVGQSGIKISGGEKQRIAIARALVKKSEILLVDEATSNLDQETERGIIKTIKNLKNVTIIIAAHREIFSEISDKIYKI